MASLVRAVRQGCRVFTATRPILAAQNHIRPSVRPISTSKKNKDAAVIPEDTQSAPVEENLEAKEENWISYGYSLTDREQDEFDHHALLFVGISLCLVGGAYVLAYLPDLKQRDWIQREAYLELARREKEGLPLIDKNLIDPSKIELPSDEELGDTNIII